MFCRIPCAKDWSELQENIRGRGGSQWIIRTGHVGVPSPAQRCGASQCSRCERCPDTASACAASSTVVPPTCAPLPPWPPPSASDGSDADTLCETGDRNELRLAPLPPATCAACGCPAW